MRVGLFVLFVFSELSNGMMFKLRSHLTHFTPHSHGSAMLCDSVKLSLCDSCIIDFELDDAWMRAKICNSSSHSLCSGSGSSNALASPGNKTLNDDATVVTGCAVRAAFFGRWHSLLSLSESSSSAILCILCISWRTSSSSSHGKFLGWQIYIFKDFKFQISNLKFRVLDF